MERLPHIELAKTIHSAFSSEFKNLNVTVSLLGDDKKHKALVYFNDYIFVYFLYDPSINGYEFGEGDELYWRVNKVLVDTGYYSKITYH